MPAHKSAVPNPVPTGGRRNKTSRSKANSQDVLENIDGMLRGIVGSLEFIDPGAIDPDTVRRLTVGIRTSTNTIKRFAHLIEQHHAKKNAPDAGQGIEGNDSIHHQEEGS